MSLSLRSIKSSYLFSELNPKKLFSNWKDDLIAGIIVAVVALPLALGFAIASGAPPKLGLYTAIIGGIIASIFGGSAVQITGPTGAMAVVLIGIVSTYGLEKVLFVTFLAGLIQIILGLLKLGNLAKYIPYPVIAGFTNGIAIVIFCGQLNNLLGLKIDPTHGHLMLEKLWLTIQHFSEINYFSLGLGLLTVAIIFLWDKINKNIPASIIAIVCVSLIAYFFKLPVSLIENVGEIPKTLPTLRGFDIFGNLALMNQLVSAAIAIAALGSIESVLSALVADSMTPREKHDSNQELIGQGLANVIVPFFGGIPATGAITRTAVNVRSGAKTRLSGIIHGLTLICFVLALAPLVSKIPLAALAGVLIVASYRMFEWDSVRFLSKVTRSDLIVMLITGAVTILFDLILAVQIGVFAAGILFIRKMGNLDLLQMPEERTLASGISEELSRRIAIYRLEGPLFFGAVGKFLLILDSLPSVKYVILRMRFVSDVDSTAIVALESFWNELRKRNIRLMLSTLKPKVKETFEKSGFLDKIGTENCFNSTQEALENLANLPHIERKY